MNYQGGVAETSFLSHIKRSWTDAWTNEEQVFLNFSTWGKRTCSQNNWRRQGFEEPLKNKGAYDSQSGIAEASLLMHKHRSLKSKGRDPASSACSKLTETSQTEGSESAPKATWRRQRLEEALLKDKGSLWFPRRRWQVYWNLLT